jgi:hypothetical protein
MSDILNFVTEEVAFEGDVGCTLDRLWIILQQRCNKIHSETGQQALIFDPFLKEYWWKYISQLPQLEFIVKDTSPLPIPTKDTLSQPFTQLINDYGDDLRVRCTKESFKDIVMGNHRAKTLSPNISDVFMEVVRSREDGITQADLANVLSKDSRSVFAFIKSLLELGLVVKFPVTSRKIRTSLIIHVRFAQANPQYRGFIATTGQQSHKIGLIGHDDVDVSDEELDPEILQENTEIIKARITQVLDVAKNKTMIEGQVADALGFPMGAGKARKVCYRQFDLLKTGGYIERLQLQEQDGKLTHKVIRLIKLYVPADRAKGKAGPDKLTQFETKFHHSGANVAIVGEGYVLKDLPIDIQVFKLIDKSGTAGITAYELVVSLQGINERIMELILARLIANQKAGRNGPLVYKIGEFEGRIHRYRYYSARGMAELEDMSSVRETVVATAKSRVAKPPPPTPQSPLKQSHTVVPLAQEIVLTQPTGEVKLEDVACRECQSTEDAQNMLLCDECNVGLHLYCDDPPMDSIPEGHWFCSKDCETRFKKKSATPLPTSPVSKESPAHVNVRASPPSHANAHTAAPPNAIVRARDETTASFLEKATGPTIKHKSTIASANKMHRREVILNLLAESRILALDKQLCKQFDDHLRQTGKETPHKTDIKTLDRTCREMANTKHLKIVVRALPSGKTKSYLLHRDLDPTSDEVRRLFTQLESTQKMLGKVSRRIDVRETVRLEVEQLGEVKERMEQENPKGAAVVANARLSRRSRCREDDLSEMEEDANFPNVENRAIVGRLSSITSLHRLGPSGALPLEKLNALANGYIEGKMLRARALHEWLFERVLEGGFDVLTGVEAFAEVEQEPFSGYGVFSAGALLTDMPVGIYRRVIGIVKKNPVISAALTNLEFERMPIGRLPIGIREQVIDQRLDRFRRTLKSSIDILIAMHVLKPLPKLDVQGNIVRPEVNDYLSTNLSSSYQVRRIVPLPSHFDVEILPSERVLDRAVDLRSFWQDYQRLNGCIEDITLVPDDEYLWIRDEGEVLPTQVAPRKSLKKHAAGLTGKTPLTFLGSKTAWDLIPTVRGNQKAQVDLYVRDYFYDHWHSHRIPEQGIKELARKVHYDEDAVRRRVAQLEHEHVSDLQRGIVPRPEMDLGEDGILKRKRRSSPSHRPAKRSKDPTQKAVIVRDRTMLPVGTLVLGKSAPKPKPVPTPKFTGAHLQPAVLRPPEPLPKFAGHDRTVHPKEQGVWLLEDDEDLLLGMIILHVAGDNDIECMAKVLNRSLQETENRISLLRRNSKFRPASKEMIKFWKDVVRRAKEEDVRLVVSREVLPLSRAIVYFRDCLRLARFTILDQLPKGKVKQFPEDLTLLDRFFVRSDPVIGYKEGLPYEDRVDKEPSLRSRLMIAYNSPMTNRISEETTDALGGRDDKQALQYLKMLLHSSSKEVRPAMDVRLLERAIGDALQMGLLTRKTKSLDKSVEALLQGSLGLSERSSFLLADKPSKLLQEMQSYFQVLGEMEDATIKIKLTPMIPDGSAGSIIALLADRRADLQPTMAIMSTSSAASSSARAAVGGIDLRCEVKFITHRHGSQLRNLPVKVTNVQDYVYGKPVSMPTPPQAPFKKVDSKDAAVKILPHSDKLQAMYAMIDASGPQGVFLSQLLQFGKDTRPLLKKLCELQIEGVPIVSRVGCDYVVYVSHRNLDTWMMQMPDGQAVLPHVWYSIDGTRNDAMYQKCLELVMHTLVKKPGMPFARLHNRISNMVLTRAEMHILLDDLENRGALSKIVLQKARAGLWDDEPIHTVADASTANPQECITHYFPNPFWMKKL